MKYFDTVKWSFTVDTIHYAAKTILIMRYYA